MKKLTISILALFIASVSYAFTDESNLTSDPLPIESHSLSSMPKLAPVKSTGTKLETALVEFLSIYQTKGAKPASDFALIHDIDFNDGQVRVELSLRKGITTTSLNFTGTNVEIISQSDHFIIVKVPVEQLESFAADMIDVMLVHRPHKMITDVTNEGFELIGGDVFHNEDITGEGVKIAVVDGGYNRLSDGQEEGELPANPTMRNFTQEAFEDGSVHGAACTEIVYDFVPDADFYLVKVATDADIENAIDYLIEEQVDIATMSLSFPNAFDDYYQGHDPVSNKVTEAFEAGIFYVNSAGNQGQKHYRAEFDDQDHDENVHMFADNVYVNHFGSRPDRIATLAQNTSIWASLAWDDFPESGVNYDLYVVFFDTENEEWIQVAESTTEQDGDDLPTEWVSYRAEARGYYGLIVQNNGGADGVDFTLFTSHDLGYKTVEGSITIPGLSENDFAVGAVYQDGWESENPTLQSFSSGGPTYDNRIKPDISGTDGVSSFIYEREFFGTSAAAPSVAGAAALVLSAQDMTNAELWNWLTAHAEDRGERGQDNGYGHGLCHIEMDFEEASDIEVTWSEDYGYPDLIDFGNVALDDLPFELTLQVSNIGNDFLELEEIFSDADYLDITPEDMALEPDESGEVLLSIESDDYGNYENILTFISNDPDNEELEIPIRAIVGEPPVIEVEPLNIEVDGGGEHTITIGNTGVCRLRYFIEAELVDEPDRDEDDRSMRRGNIPRRDDLGDILGEFSWEGAGEDVYKPGIAYNPEDGLIYLTNYNGHSIGVVDPSENYREVANYDVGERSLFGAAWLNGILYCYDSENTTVTRYNSEGENLGDLELDRRVSALTASQEEGVLLALERNHPYRIVAYRVDGDEVRRFAFINWREGNFANVESRSICWVDCHKDNQLWINSPNRIFNFYVDAENAVCEHVQDFEYNNDNDQFCGIGHDGRNLIFGPHDFDHYEIVDDGIEEIPWLTIDPMEGVLEAEDEDVITVILDDTGLISGDYEVDMRILSNDPENQLVLVHILMSVRGTPDIDLRWDEDLGFVEDENRNVNVEESVLNFNVLGDIFNGESYEIPVTVRNEGTDWLEIDDITYEGDDVWSIDPQEMVIDPTDEANVVISFRADESGEYNANLIFISNDPDEEELSVRMTATSLDPPVIGVDPMEIETDGPRGEVITVSNSGEAPLRFTTDIRIISEPERDIDVRSLRNVESASAPQRDDLGDQIGEFTWDAAGENDYKVGITYNPNDNLLYLTTYADHTIGVLDPAQDYEEVTRYNTENNFLMNAAWLNGIMYCINYNNQTVTQFNAVGENLGNMGLGINRPVALAASVDEGVLLVMEGEGNFRIHVLSIDDDGIEEIDIIDWRQGDFEAISCLSICWIDSHPDQQLWMSSSNHIWNFAVDVREWVVEPVQDFEYDNSNNAWCGIGHDGDDLILGVYASDHYEIVNDGVIEFWWIMLEPREGIVEPDSELEIRLILSDHGCLPGDYEAELTFNSNDPANQEVIVNVLMHITEVPDIDLQWDEDWGYVADEDGNVDIEQAVIDLSGSGIYIGGPYDSEITVINKGSANLEIEEIFTEGDEVWSVNEEEMVLESEEEAVITFSFEAEEPGAYEGTITFVSNDPDEEELTIRMFAEAIEPPDIGFDPHTIEDDLLTGVVETYSITMENTGDASVSWHTEIEIISEPEEERDYNARSLRGMSGAAPRRDEPGDLIASFEGINAADEYSSCIGWDYDNGRMWVTNYNAGIAAAYTHDANYEEFEEVARIEVGANMDGCWVNGLLFIPEEFRSGNVNRWDENGENIGAIQFDYEVCGLAADAEEQLLLVQEFGNNYPIHVYAINEDNEQDEELGEINNYNPFEMFNGVGLEWVAAHKEAPLWMTEGREGIVYQIAVDRDRWQCIDSDDVVSFRVGDIGPSYSTVAHDGEYIWASGYTADDIRIYDDGYRDDLWITVEPDEGSLESDDAVQIEVTVDTHDLISGEYIADISFLSDDDDELGIVRVIIHITGVPDIDVVWSEVNGYPDLIDFGEVFSGFESSLVINILNTGGTALEVEDVSINSDEYTVDPVEFVIDPDESQEVTLTFYSEETGVFEDTLLIISNANNNGELEIPVRAEVVGDPPVIVVEPRNIEIEVGIEGPGPPQRLNIANEGGSSLRFHINVDVTNSPYLDEINVEDISNMRFAVFQTNASWGWLDEVMLGQEELINDDNCDYFRDWNALNDIDFDDYDAIVINANGEAADVYNRNIERLTEYVNDGGGLYFEMGRANQQIRVPGGFTNSGGGANNGVFVVSPFDDDDNYSLLAEIFHSTQPDFWEGNELIEGEPFLLSSYPMGQFADALDNDVIEYYQLIAVPQGQQNGGIVAYGIGKGHILTICHPTGQCWQNFTGEGQWGSVCTEILYFLTSSNFRWITVEPSESPEHGIDPNGDIDIDVIFNTEDLVEGDYEADILIFSNDPENPVVYVSVMMFLNGIPLIEVDPDSIDFGFIEANRMYELPLTIKSVGSGTLEVVDITFTDDIGFSVDQREDFLVDPREERDIIVSFNSENESLFETTMIISSNAFWNERLEIPVRACTSDNLPPQVVREIPDIEIDEDSEPFFIENLNNFFSDPDDDQLGFNAVSDDGHIDLEIDDDSNLLLEVHGDWNGVMTITVTADDGYRPERNDAPVRSLRSANGSQEKTFIECTKTPLLSFPRRRESTNNNRLVDSCLRRNDTIQPRRDWTTELEFELTVNPINDRPNIFNAPEEIDAREDDNIEFDVWVYDADVASEWDNDSLRFSFLEDDGLVEKGAAFEVIDGMIGRFTWQTGYDDAGVYVPIIRVQDNFHERDLCAVRINVSNNNRAPEYIAEIPPIEFDEDDGVAMVATLNEHFRDPDGGRLNFLADGEGLYTAVNEASQLFIRPRENWNGVSSLNITARDNLNQDTCMDIPIRVNAVNDPPSDFSLLTPDDYAVIGTFPNVEFTWETSDDIEDSTVVYTLLIEFIDYGGEIERRNIQENHIEIPREWLSYDPNEPRRMMWSVWAEDGTDSVRSQERFNLTIRPLSANSDEQLLPTEIALGPAYPNPFNASVTLDFALPEAGRVVMDVFNINGNLIKTITNDEYNAGYHQIVWNGKDIATGIYLCRMRVDGKDMKIIKLVYSR
ncbi:S8 family serine peptidase [bacterium]|nr:S8 family serine peptidase [bacterium]